MSLSKKARKGIADFNRATSWQYRISYKNQLDSYIAAYEAVTDLAAEEAQLDAEIDNQVG